MNMNKYSCMQYDKIGNIYLAYLNAYEEKGKAQDLMSMDLDKDSNASFMIYGFLLLPNLYNFNFFIFKMGYGEIPISQCYCKYELKQQV